jgi:hypothetical protein
VKTRNLSRVAESDRQFTVCNQGIDVGNLVQEDLVDNHEPIRPLLKKWLVKSHNRALDSSLPKFLAPLCGKFARRHNNHICRAEKFDGDRALCGGGQAANQDVQVSICASLRNCLNNSVIENLIDSQRGAQRVFSGRKSKEIAAIGTTIPRQLELFMTGESSRVGQAVRDPSEHSLGAYDGLTDLEDGSVGSSKGSENGLVEERTYGTKIVDRIGCV